MKTPPINDDHHVARRGQSGGKPGASNLEPKTPYPFEHLGITLRIQTESDGRGGTRFWFKDPREEDEEDSGRHRIRRSARQKIEEVAADVIEQLKKLQRKFTLKQCFAIQRMKEREHAFEEILQPFGLNVEETLQAVADTMKRLPTGVALQTVLQAGLERYCPPNPQCISQVVAELLPSVKSYSTRKHYNNLKANLDPLLNRYGDRLCHLVTTVELEQLLFDVARGRFLSAEERAKALARREAELEEEFDGETVYDGKTLRHFFDAWRRVFIRAGTVKALPTGFVPPTKDMEKPTFDKGDGEAIQVPQYQTLLPALDHEELRYVALLITDIRSSETKALDTSSVSIGSDRLPTLVHIEPTEMKGKKGTRQGRIVSLNPTQAVLLAACLPKAGLLLPSSPTAVQMRIAKKAAKLGIQWEHNFIRHAHDTYWYALLNGTKQVNTDSSHTKAMTDTIYRQPASFEDAVRFWATLPPCVPAHHRAWVEEWLERQCRQLKGRSLREIIGPPTTKQAGGKRPAHK